MPNHSEVGSNSSVDLVAARKRLLKDKPFISALCTNSITRRLKLLKSATEAQLKNIQRLVVLFVSGALPVNARLLARLKKFKKWSYLNKNFQQMTTDGNILKKLSQIASFIRYFAKIILKKLPSQVTNTNNG